MEPDRRGQISDLYHAALGRPPHERNAFLSEACQGDAALRQEVESLLRYESESARFLERPAADAAAGALAGTAGEASMLNRQLGPYTIVAPLGTGGMGEVYRARDTRLGREVAIKILPPHLTSDPERRARFAREARLLATLNHPHIGAIYGLEESDGATALVLELVEGPTLAERLARGPLPIPQALAIARQLAEALDAAHEKGIVHRDLKPANIVLHAGTNVMSSDVHAKVLDFGLAKTLANEPANDLTRSLEGTADGRIMGTPAYMSPEQARGLSVDKRTDIWAFGCVLFEMLSGRRAFAGATVTDTLARILEREPEWTLLPSTLPQPVAKIVRRCLEKDPARRLRDIGDVTFDLREAQSTDLTDRVSAAPIAGRRVRRFVWFAAVSGLVVASFLVGRLGWPASETLPAEAPLVQADVDLGLEASPLRIGISPNGERLVFISNARLMTRRLDQDQLVSMPLAGTEGAADFCFSPDSRSVAFIADRKLKRAAIDGGPIDTVSDDVAEGRGLSWGDDNTIVVAGVSGGLHRTSAAGSKLSPLTRLAAGEFTHRWPQFLPGASAVLFTSHSSATWFDQARIDVLSLADGQRKTLVERATFGRFVPAPDGTGYLTFVRGGTLFAALFDANRLELVGSPFPVIEGVNSEFMDMGYSPVELSRTGVLIYQRRIDVRLDWLGASGVRRPLLANPGDYRNPEFSPDGRRLAFVSAGAVWSYDLDRDVPIQLTKGPSASGPHFTWDGQFMVFSTIEGISWVRADGGSNPELLLPSTSPLVRWASSIQGSHDHGRLAYGELTTGTGELWNVWTVPLRVEGLRLRAMEPEPYLRTSADEREARLSPDGRWMAYTSNESTADFEVHVRAFPNDGRKWKVSAHGGRWPRWAPRGSEVFFRSGRLIMAAPYSVTASAFHPAKPRVWSEQETVMGGAAHDNYAVSPDGQRVAALLPDPASRRYEGHVTLWLNALAEFRRRMSQATGRAPAR